MTIYHKVYVIYMILFVHNHWWRWIVDLAAWLSLVTRWVVIMTTHDATDDFGAVGLTTFDFRWLYALTIYHDLDMCVCDFFIANVLHVNLSNERFLNLNP